MLWTDKPAPGYRPNVGLMLLNGEGKVFVGRRIDMPGAWQMPQGGLDQDETPEAAALRELEEEIGTRRATVLFASPGWIGYDFPPEIVLRAFKGNWRGQAQKWFALRFTGVDRDFRLDGKHAEFDAWRWVERDKLVQLIVPFKRAVYTAVLADFEPRLRALGY